MTASLKVERTVTLGLIVTLVIQSAAGMIWVGAADARLSELEREVESRWGISERLARLEGETAMMRGSLQRIELSLINEN